MNFLNIAIPTLGLWIMDAVLITPIASSFGSGSSEIRQDQALDDEGQPVDIPEPPLGAYIATSVVVSAIAGFVAGLAGYPLIGFAMGARYWPGMIALIVASFMGFSASGASF